MNSSSLTRKQKDQPGLHPRNRHRGRYDFARLTHSLPALAPFVIQNPRGDSSIDFSNPAAVKALNRAILRDFYDVVDWEIPEGYLCPPIPGRADYIHHIADLLASFNQDTAPTGPSIRILDIGVGANCVYPIIGSREYGWNFIGTDIDEVALSSARKIADANPKLKGAVELRLQKSPSQIFRGILKPGEKFDLSICNPPFHSSLEEAQESSLRKWKNLGKDKPLLKNFGGQASELWSPGGEAEFVRKMIHESVEIRTQCRWFSTLISKVAHLEDIYKELRKVGVVDYREQMMFQGQKVSRIVAWTFQRETHNDQ